MLWLHIIGGIGAVVFGFAPLFLAKGSVLHRRTGTLFVGCILVMGTIGTATAPFLPIEPSQRFADVLLGVFAVYLVVTGWSAARRYTGVGRIEKAAIIVPGLTAVAMLIIAAMWTADLKRYGEVQTVVMLVLAALVAACAAADASVILRGGLKARQRLVRHLLRMCTGLLLATAGGLAQSGILGVIPEAWRNPIMVSSPVVVIFVLMCFWLVRVGFSRAWAKGGGRVA